MANKPDLLKTTAADLANGGQVDGTPGLPDNTLRVKVTGSATRRLDLDAQFEVAPAQRVAVIGHNGSGKTSVLRLIAGLDYARPGTVITSGSRTLIDDSTHLSVPERQIPMTFAEPRLFPHMSVLKNLTFGPRKGRRTGNHERIKAKALEALKSLGLSHLANRPAGELSSGQSATIAVLRTVFADSCAVVLDEPFSALDTAIASEVRSTVRSWLETLSVPLLIATHNPLDVMSLATHVAVMEHGKLTQFGTVAEVALQPRSQFTAQFLGLNLLRGTATGPVVSIGAEPKMLLMTAQLGDQDSPANEGQDVFTAFSPASVTLSQTEPHGSAQNTWLATVIAVEQLGSIMRITLESPALIRADITTAAALNMGVSVGQKLWTSVKATAIEVYRA